MFVKLNVQGDLLEKLTEDSKRRHRSCTQQVMFILDMYYNYKHIYDSRCEPEDLSQRSLPMDYMAQQRELALREGALNTNHHVNTQKNEAYNNDEYDNSNDDDNYDDEMYDDEFDSAYNF